jgi:hypothetical protein
LNLRGGRTATGAVVLSALLLAGCGATPLSVKALISRATVVCDRATVRTNLIPTPTIPAGGKRFLSHGAASLQTELTTLRRLRPPASESKSYETALAALGQIVAELNSAVRALAHGGDPIDTIEAVQRRLAPVEVRESQAWRALDVPACAVTT